MTSDQPSPVPHRATTVADRLDVDVVVVGSLNMDLIAVAPRLPVPGETLLGTGFLSLPGGKGANQAVAAARAGSAVCMVGRVGPDEFGMVLRSGLSAEGIAIDLVGVCKHDPTGVALITVAEDGENSIVVVPGANAMLRAVHIDDASRAITRATVVLLQLEIPIETALHAARMGAEAGKTVILNPAPFPVAGLPDELLRSVSVLVVNESELAAMGGAARVCDIVDVVVVTRGSAGVTVHHEGTTSTVAALEVDVVDATGAGDTFCGYLAAKIARGASVMDAVRIANRAAGMSVTARGARTAPLLHDVVLETA